MLIITAIGFNRHAKEKKALHERTREFGTACEQYIFQEISAYKNLNHQMLSICYWRSYEKYEVDFVIELENADLILIEVKSSTKVETNPLHPLGIVKNQKKAHIC